MYIPFLVESILVFPRTICLLLSSSYLLFFFFFNDTATTEIYTLSLHDALPILETKEMIASGAHGEPANKRLERTAQRDRKSTRLNSSHVRISYAVFCLKKKKNTMYG